MGRTTDVKKLDKTHSIEKEMLTEPSTGRPLLGNHPFTSVLRYLWSYQKKQCKRVGKRKVLETDQYKVRTSSNDTGETDKE